jgi:hypothetical protein
MLQRIQTLYLFLVFTIDTLLLIANPIYAEFKMRIEDLKSPSSVLMQFWKQVSMGANQELPIESYKFLNLVFMLMIAALAVYAIFLYQNRKAQIKISRFLIAANTAFLVVILVDFYLTKQQFVDLITLNNLGYQIVWPILMFVLSILAFMGIRSDEKLVQSMDRIR